MKKEKINLDEKGRIISKSTKFIDGYAAITTNGTFLGFNTSEFVAMRYFPKSTPKEERKVHHAEVIVKISPHQD